MTLREDSSDGPRRVFFYRREAFTQLITLLSQATTCSTVMVRSGLFEEALVNSLPSQEYLPFLLLRSRLL